MVQQTENLGLKLVDLQTNNTALKAAWPIRWHLRNQEELKWFYQYLLITDNRIWECNLDPADVNRIVKIVI